MPQTARQSSAEKDPPSTLVRPKPSKPEAPRVVPALTILSHPLPQRAGDRLLLDAIPAGGEVRVSRVDPDFTRPGSLFGTPLDDPFLSRKPLVFAAGRNGGVRLSLPAEGKTSVVAGVPIQGSREFELAEVAAGVPLELAERVVVLLHLTTSSADCSAAPMGMVGQSTSLCEVRQHVARIADRPDTVLIRGETGSGKELVARAIHEQSPRRSGPFISVNMGAITRELAAAELFGAQKGSYSGSAQDRKGFFRAAQGGTLFLDEVGEAPPEIQVMLLRALETREIFPVGAHSPVDVDVRVIAATDANLERQIEEGRFKAPLKHRLASYEIRLPALRQRREDIGLLFFHFAREELESLGELHHLTPTDPRAEPWLPAPLAARLARHPWPGNIRELRNVVRKLVLGSRGHAHLLMEPGLAPELYLDDSPPEEGEETVKPTPPKKGHRKPSEVTEEELRATLAEHGWERKATADALGIARPSLYDLLKKFGIQTPEP